MAQTSQPSADDIAYIRHLSESGARAPLFGGRFMAWWGFLLVVAYLGQHLAINGLIGERNLIFGIIWGGFALFGVGGQLILARSIAGKPGQGSAGNRAMRSVWAMGAMSIGAMVVGCALIPGGAIGEHQVPGNLVPGDTLLSVEHITEGTPPTRVDRTAEFIARGISA